jgi:hypothetical protein
MVPLAFPYDFDTAGTWRTIVKIAALVVAIFAFMIVGLVIKGEIAASIGVFAFGVLFWSALRRLGVARIPMGASGRLTASDVVVDGVKLWNYSLNVPVGRFPIGRFEAVAVVEHVVMGRTASTTYDNVGSVQLVGRAGTPNIEVMVAPIDAANAFAKELSAKLALELRSLATPGTKITRIQL